MQLAPRSNARNSFLIHNKPRFAQAQQTLSLATIRVATDIICEDGLRLLEE
jgi:hypothetical protein